jgi:hypothetical protein
VEKLAGPSFHTWVCPLVRLSRILWVGVIERTEKRLASGEKIYLNEGGRFTLIKSILSFNLLSIFSPIPVGLANRLKKVQRDFL